MSEHLREEELVPYLDGRLDESDRRRLEAHAAACADCRARVEETRALFRVLGEWKAEEPSPAFDAAVRARLEAEEAEGAGWFWLRPVYAGALAAVLLMAAVWVLWRPVTTEAPGEAPPQVAEVKPPVERAPAPPAPVEQTPEPAPAGDDLAALDNPVLLEHYELLEGFDALFEPLAKEEKKL
jgi:anti-sigma factor RsiW